MSTSAMSDAEPTSRQTIFDRLPGPGAEAASLELPASPTRLLQLALCFEQAQALFAAHRLGVFEAVARGARMPETIAARCHLPPRSARALVSALVALGLLVMAENGLRNADDVGVYLVPGEPHYLGDVLEYEMDSVYPVWGQLAGSLREDRAAGGMSAWDYMYGDPESCTKLVAMRETLGYLYGPPIAERLDLAAHSSLLVVGDAGRYVFWILRAFPHLQAVIADGQPNLEVIRASAERHEFRDRVRLHAVHFMSEPFPRGCDSAFVPEILQNWDDDTLIAILERIRCALPPGAPLALAEFWISEDHNAPIGTCMHSLQMVLRSEVGRHRSDSEILRLVARAGFAEGRSSPPFGRGGIEAALPMALYHARVPS